MKYVLLSLGALGAGNNHLANVIFQLLSNL